MLAAVLHLGNINFETVANKNAADGSKVSAESIGNNMCVHTHTHAHTHTHTHTHTHIHIHIYRYAGDRIEVAQVRRGGAEQGHDLLARQGD